MNKRRKEVIRKNELSALATYTLGGYSQKVLLEGKSIHLPIVVFLHGGPGSPIPFSVGSRGMFPEFTDKCIMVYWDQLGCGINNYPIDNSFTIQHFVEMTIDLIKELKKGFPNNRIILFGVSWGSILAAKTALAIPELIDRVMVYGQVLKKLGLNEEVFKELAKAELPDKERAEVEGIHRKKRPTVNDLKMITQLIGKYTEGYQVKKEKQIPMVKIMLGLLTSPDYTLKDFIAMFKNSYEKNTSLLKELMAAHLAQNLAGIGVPYRILQGSKDIVTSTGMIKEFVLTSQNPNISLNIIENSAHLPSKKGMDRILEDLLRFSQGMI